MQLGSNNESGSKLLYIEHMTRVLVHFLLATTVEHPKRGQFGSRDFVLCSEVVPLSKVPIFIAFFIAYTTTGDNCE